MLTLTRRGGREDAFVRTFVAIALAALAGCGGSSSGGQASDSSAGSSAPSGASEEQKLALSAAGSGGTVVPGTAATKLVFTVQPSNVVAGTTIAPAIQVSVEDASNNVVGNSTAMITLAFGTNAGGAGTTLGGTLSRAAVAGVATFNDIAITKAVNGYTIVASTTGLTTATSAAFNVVPGTPVKLAITGQPHSVAANALISPAITVAVEDTFNNPISTFSSTVTASIANNAGGGTLHGTIAQATVAGVANFPNLSIDQIGHGYTLTFASSLGGVPSVTSAAFDVGLNGVANKLAITSATPTNVSATAAIAPSLQVTVEDAFGVKVATATTSITVSIAANPGGGALTGTTTVSAVSGVATFSALHIDKVGNGYTLQASATGLSGAVSAGFNIVNGAATHLAFTSEPSNAVSTNAISPSVVVAVLDAGNNVVTGSSASIAIAFGTNAGPGTLSGTQTVAAINGVATFSNLSIDKAANGYTLKAVSGTLTAATSQAFDIQIGPPTKLAITAQPKSAARNALLGTVTVAVEDSGGNIVAAPSESVTVAIANNPSGGTLFGTLTQATTNGIATFSNLSIDTVGLGYTLSFTSSNGSVAGATSTAFNCGLAGVAARLAFTVEPPTTGTSQTSLAPAIQVTVEDAFGTKVSSTATIALAFAANPNGGTLGGTLSVAAVGGVATFSAVKIDKVGAGYTLDATSAGLLSATSTAVSINPGAATHMSFTTQPTSGTAATALAPISVSLLDAGGNVATGSNANVTMAIGTNPGAGALSGTATVAASSGVATFSTLSINKVGTGYTIAASATGITGATSTAFNIALGPPSKLSVTVQPANAAANALISPSIQVTVQDAGGNTVSSPPEQITASIGTNPSGGTLSGTLTQATLNGIATFNNLNIDQVGKNYTLSFASSTGGVTGTVSNPFNIGLIGVANKLAFSVQPSNAAAAQAIAPPVQVTVEDAFGTKVSSTVSITISIADNAGGGTLTGTLSVAAVSGVATFSALHIDKIGNGYTLQASASGLISGTSSGFNVTVGPATKLAFTTQPTSALATAVISPSIVVSLLDAGGNVATTTPANVTLALGASPGSGALSGTLVQASSNGVATFNDVSVNRAGNGYTVTASSGTLTGATSSAFNITQGSAAKLGVIVQPSNAGPGALISPSIQVAIQDAGGNTLAALGDSITVSIANNPAGSTLSGTLTQTTTGGIATFPNLSLDQLALGYTLKFHANNLVVTDAVSAAFGIGHAGVQDHLGFTVQPASTASTNAITPAVQVTVEDIFGTKVSSTASITVAIASNPSSGTLSGTKTVAASGGVATFSTLAIDKVGTGYTLSATAPVLTGSTSAGFNIVPGAPAKLAFSTQPQSTFASYILAPIQVQLVDAGGNNTTGNNTVTIAIGTNPGGGTLSGTLSVAAVNGVATFNNLSIDKAATGYTLVATSTSLTQTTSASFTINASAATQLVFSKQPPANATAGVAFPVQVALADERGNPVNISGDTITLSGSSTLTATTVNGVASFSVVLKQTGPYTLNAFNGTAILFGTSAKFNVVPGPAKSLLFTTQPTVAKPGAALPPFKVSIVDAFANPETTGSSTVTLTFGTNQTGATLGGTLSVAAVNGVATFSNVNVSLAGQGYTLTAASAGLESLGSAPFNITPPGTPAKAVFKVQPTNVTAGGNFSSTIQVAVQDSAGTTMTGATGTVFLSTFAGSFLSLTGSTSAPLVNGVASFSGLGVGSGAPGTHQLTTFVSLSPFTSIVSFPSNAFTLFAGAPNRLSFIQANAGLANVNPGQTIGTLTVQVVDQNGDLCSSATNAITVSLRNPNGAALAGTVTRNAVNGVATFSNLSINRSGTYTFMATAPGGLNTNFTFTPSVTVGLPGEATRVSIINFPPSGQGIHGTVGQPLAPLQVAVQDLFLNTITSSTDTVTMALVDQFGSPLTLTGTTSVQAVNGLATFSNLIPGALGYAEIDPSDGTLDVNGAFLSIDAPVSTVSPSSGSASGGTAVTITGSGFAPGASVYFGNSVNNYYNASNVAVLSSTALTCTTPAINSNDKAGTFNVAVGVPNGPAQLVNGFTYFRNWFESDQGIAGADVRALAVHPVTPDVVVVGTGLGAYVSTHESAWQPVPNITGTAGAVAIAAVSSTIFIANNQQVARTSGGSSIAQWFFSYSSTGPFSNVTTIVPDPTNASIVYCGTSGEGVFKSIDGGANFYAINSGLTNLNINALTINPSNANTLYAGTPGNGVYITTNAGTTWVQHNTGLMSPLDVGPNSILVDPHTPTTLYLGMENGPFGVYTSVNGGTSWTSMINTSNVQIKGLAFSTASSQTIYAATSNLGVLTTTNAGSSWTSGGPVLLTPFIAAVAADATTNNALFVGDRNGGIYRSTDNGANFAFAGNGLKDVYAGGGSGMGGTGGQVAFDPVTPSNVYAATYGDGLFKSVDGGATWTRLNGNPFLNGIVIDPTTPANLYTSWDFEGIAKSTDGGNTWNQVNNGLHNFFSAQIMALAIAPSTPATLYCASASEFSKTTDGASSWTQPGAIGLPIGQQINTILVDPSDATHVYVAFYGAGVYQSFDSGATFATANSGLFNTFVNQLALTSTTGPTLFAATSDQMYESTNGGATWSVTSLGAFGWYSVAAAPSNANVIYAGSNANVYQSSDGGATWAPSSVGNFFNVNVKSIAVDPNDPNTAIAGLLGNAVWRTVGGTPLPRITNVSPLSQGTGMQVTITGVNLGGAVVTFGGGPPIGPVSDNGSTLVVDVPPGSASGNVAVTTVAGTTTYPGFTFIPPPSITSFAQTAQVISGTVTITGTNLSNAQFVAFGSGPGATITNNTSTTITAIVPKGSSSGNVFVATPGGTVQLAGFSLVHIEESVVPPSGTTAPAGVTRGPDGQVWFVEATGNAIGRASLNGGTTAYSIPTSASSPCAITVGPDGNLWFTEQAGNKIGRITLAGTITEFSIPTSSAAPQGIIAGPDGNLWFTESGASKIGRITTTGTIAEFTLPTPSAGPCGIAAGSDGNLWFTEQQASNVGKITTAGVITELSVPTPASLPTGIAAGPDGNLWFTEQGATTQIGRVTTAGVFTEFATPTASAAPNQITSGPDGNLWFTETGANQIGSVSTSGLISEFAVPTSSSTSPWGITASVDGSLWFTENTAGNGLARLAVLAPVGTFTETPLSGSGFSPTEVCLGPDGNVWFTESGGSFIARLTPAGVLTEFATPTPNSNPFGITAGPDGNVWFTENLGNNVGRITTAGAITEFPIPTVLANTYEIAAGPDGNLWFTENNANKIGRITPSGTITEFTLPTSSAGPFGITAGPDGNVYFTENAASQIGQITPAGVITEFATPTPDAQPLGITLARGFLYFTEAVGNIAQCTTGGLIGEVPTGSTPFGIATAPDGFLWFTDQAQGRIVRISPIDASTQFFSVPTTGASPQGITVGPDGSLWFVENATQKVGKVTP